LHTEFIEEDIMPSYPEPVTDIVRRRRSWRSYQETPLTDEQKRLISGFISSLDPPPFGTGVRFALVDSQLPGRKRMPGTYGVIKGAKSILVGAMSPSPMEFEDFGYSFESIILFCTGLGLGTCWIGGTLDRDLFGRLIGVRPGETIPAVSPVGVMEGRRNLLDSLFALSAGSKNRKPFGGLFFVGDFSKPMTEEDCGGFAQVLEMVRLAPSAMNRQPWRIVLREDRFHFFLMRTPGYHKLTGPDLQRVDMGIAMLHFHAAAVHFGLKGSWEQTDAGRAIPCPNGMEYRFSWIPAA
jgi:nitroreductase